MELLLGLLATPVGSTYMLASARDWARFGMLYSNDGVAGGRRILPEGWVHYSSMPTLGSGYAAGFWLKKERGMPPDSLYASGFLGQEIAVIPSEKLVVARFGMIREGRERLDPLVGAVRAALGAQLSTTSGILLSGTRFFCSQAAMVCTKRSSSAANFSWLLKPTFSPPEIVPSS